MDISRDADAERPDPRTSLIVEMTEERLPRSEESSGEPWSSPGATLLSISAKVLG